MLGSEDRRVNQLMQGTHGATQAIDIQRPARPPGRSVSSEGGRVILDWGEDLEKERVGVSQQQAN